LFRSSLLLALAATVQLTAADVRGIWSGTAETNGGRIGIVVTLKQDGQALSGTVATSDDTIPEPIESADVRGDTVTFEMHDDARRLVKYRLALADGVMTGDITAGDRVSRVELVPVADAGFYPIAGGRLSSQPLLIRQVQPGYTEGAHTARLQGTVVLQVEIDPSGKVVNSPIRIARSLGLGLDEKAIEAVKQWKFKPAVRNGVPVTAPSTLEINFRM
jgi:TonB family protein